MSDSNKNTIEECNEIIMVTEKRVKIYKNTVSLETKGEDFVCEAEGGDHLILNSSKMDLDDIFNR